MPDQGTLKDTAGKLQEAAGKTVGSIEQQLQGIRKQAESHSQKTVGELKAVVKEARQK